MMKFVSKNYRPNRAANYLMHQSSILRNLKMKKPKRKKIPIKQLHQIYSKIPLQTHYLPSCGRSINRCLFIACLMFLKVFVNLEGNLASA